MVVPIFSTKLYIPSIRAGLIQRQRLLERLNEGLSSKLTLLSAPAGYGKTTLLSAWADQCGLPVAWISLDDGDNDLAHFLIYLASALEQVCPTAGQDLLVRIQSPRPPQLNDLLLPMINTIDQANQPFILILDDYHLIHEQAIHGAVLFMLDHLPASMHLVIASRGDPPLRLARLRARSHLLELRLADLCFSLEETEQFLNQVMQLNLSHENIAQLTTRTEGWAAGLQMAAVSLREQENKPAFIQSFSSSNRYILDYLVEEILQCQPPEIQAFLMDTSILALLTGSLCDAISGQDGSQETLEYLERENLFIVPMDEDRRWYRYHQLFLDLLRKRLRRASPEKVPVLHGKASQWFEENHFPAEAVEHALASGDLERSADLIESSAESILQRGETGTFSTWISRLPPELVDARPGLKLYQAWFLLTSNQSMEVVESIIASLPPDMDLVQVKADVIRGYIAILRSDLAGAVDRVRRVYSLLPESEAFFRNLAGWLLSYAHVAVGDFSSGHHSLEEITQASLEKGNFAVASSALCQLAEVHLRQAQLGEARHDYERVLEIGKAGGGWQPFAAQALVGMGELFREANDLDSAARYIKTGIELGGRSNLSVMVTGHIALARIREALGDRDGSDRAIQQALVSARQTKASDLDDLAVMVVLAQIQVARGELEKAACWVQERGLGDEFDATELDRKEDFTSYHIRKYECLVLARYLIATGESQKALSILNELRVRMEVQGRRRLLLEAYMLEALAYRSFGKPVESLCSLGKALEIACPEGYIRLFVNEGPEMRRVLEDFVQSYREEYGAGSEGVNQSEGQDLLLYAQSLINNFPGMDSLQPQPATIPHLPAASAQMVGSEPRKIGYNPQTLSERELELLRLIAEGLTNQDIAERLFISLPTVKWHTRNIYGKLDVENRTQAVAKARAIGILPA